MVIVSNNFLDYYCNVIFCIYISIYLIIVVLLNLMFSSYFKIVINNVLLYVE